MIQRRLAWAVWVVSIVFAVVWIVLDAAVVRGDSGVLDYVFILGAIVLYATVGALITSRQRANRMGVLFAWVALAAAVCGASGAYGRLAVERQLPLLEATTWLANVGVVLMIGPIAFLFLIFPTGAPPSRRWGWLLKLMLGAYAVTAVSFALTPGIMKAGFADVHGRVMNPIGFPLAWKESIEAVTTFFGGIVFVGAIVSALSLIQRYRRAETTERQQIRWLAWLGAFTALYIVVMFVLEASGVLPERGFLSDLPFIVLIALLFFGIPITCAIAILRHGLWDLDVVVKKTVQYGVLVIGLLAVVALVLVGASVIVVGRGGGLPPGLVLGLIAGTLVALLVGILRLPARRLANRVVYGGRATPYEVLSEFAERVGETYSTEDVLPRMAQLLGEATGARVARVWLRVGSVMRAEVSWPQDASTAPDVPVVSGNLPAFGEDRAFEVRHQGDLLGALTVTEAADDPMDATKAKLAADMAAQAGLVLRNVRLIEELRDSRRRIVAAQDEERRRLERNIHDGAQQQLVALQVTQRLAGSMIERDPARAYELMEQLQRDTASALDDLRDLARGIYPPLLADEGLAAAIGSQARKSPIPVEVHPDGIGRYPQEVEAAVYFSCLEALQNVAKYAGASLASVRLSQQEDMLRFEVSDDGRGFDPDTAPRGSGLQGIADRLEALGGSVAIRSIRGEGTTVSGSVPLGMEPRA
jgi:signal transduction histidine kinase